jgi:RNA polymerase sigma factor (sigma-70 family)
VFHEVVRLLTIRRQAQIAEDVAQTIAERVLRNPAPIMANYPDPLRYARVSTWHGHISFQRSERAQRGEGARLARHDEGHRAARTALSGDAVGPGGRSLFDTLPADARPEASVEVTVTEHLSTADLLDQCLIGLSDVDRRIMLLVDGHGLAVTEVALVVGQRRETVSRRLGRARRHARRQASRSGSGGSA